MSSCGSASKSANGASSFYCGVAGYTCLDPAYSSVVTNTTTIDPNLASATTIIQSELAFQGTALLVASIKRNARDANGWFQYLTWSALDLSVANVQLKNADVILPKPPTPPKPPLPPHRIPSSSYLQSMFAFGGKSANADVSVKSKITASAESGSEATLFEGERWAVPAVRSVSQLHRQQGTVVATVSWTMLFQKYQMVYVQESQDKSIQSLPSIGTVSTDSQPSTNWLTSEVLERSVRYFAYNSQLESMADVRVCAISIAANDTDDSFPFSEWDLENCAQNYTASTFGGPLQSLYDSAQCLERLSDTWQNRYGQDRYANWLIAYTVLWILVLLFALREFFKNVCRSDCINSNCCLSRKHARLLNHDNADTAHMANEEVEAAEDSAPPSQLSRRRNHRRRVLERILSFYSSRSDMDEPREGNGQRQSLLARFWEILRIPGIFSKSMFALLIIFVASLRVSHYLWILSPYLMARSDQQSDDYEVSVEKSLLVCREFSFLVHNSQMEMVDSSYWADSYLMCLWMIGFHACLCWSLVSAVARYVHSLVRRSMVTLSLPFLPQTPPADAGYNSIPSNMMATSNEANPLSTLLPNQPISEATVSASALSGPNLSNFRDNSHIRPGGRDLELSQFHSVLVPTLLHLQVIHFLSIFITILLVALVIVWLVVAVVIQKTSYIDLIRERILEGLTGKGVELFLYWTQRVTGAISIIEAIVLLAVSNWLAQMHYRVIQRSPSLSEGNNRAIENADVVRTNSKAWICICLVALLLFMQGALTIIVSQEYFHQTGSQVDSNEPSQGDKVRVTTVFSVYSLGLRILELLAIVAVSFLTIYQDTLFSLSSTYAINGGMGNGSGLSTPIDTDLVLAGENSPTYSLDGMKRADYQKKESSTPNEVEMNDSSSVGHKRSAVFGYGYEVAGPVWLNLNWALHWQKQVEKPSPDTDNLLINVAKNDVESGASRNDRSPSIETTISETSWFGWPVSKSKGQQLQHSGRNKCDEEEDSTKFMWTNPLSSMSTVYHPISKTSASSKISVPIDSNPLRDSKQMIASPSNVSFHFPQLPSSSSSVVLTDVVGATRDDPSAICEGSAKSESAVGSTNKLSLATNLSNSWSTSLSAHQSSSALSRIIRLGREQNKLTQSLRSDDFTKELKSVGSQDTDSLTTNSQDTPSPTTQSVTQS